MKLHRLAMATLLATSAMAAHAEITVSSMVGYHMYDNELSVKDRAHGSLALGYRVTPNVGMELRYGRDITETMTGAVANVRSETGTLDTYYRFNTAGKLQPYVLVGGGLNRLTGPNPNGQMQHTVVNAAVGAFYQLTDNFALRGELRGIEDMQESWHDGVASIGVTSSFGGGKKAAAAAPAAAVVAAPVAAVTTDGDDDRDGVANSKDRCPGTPTTLVVDGNGCPKVLTETVNKEIRVLFDTNKSIVKPEYNGDIEAIAKMLKDYPTAKVEIQGHTDSRGDADLNGKLSQDRADAVANALVKNFGIAADRVTAKGYGSSQPVADNKTAEGQAKNRRVIANAAGEVKVSVKK